MGSLGLFMKGFDKDVKFVFDVTENREPFLVSEEV